MKEKWKRIPDGGDVYEVSNFGRVRSVHIKREIPQSYAGQGKYPRVALSIRCGSLFRYVHRLVAQMFVPNPQNKPEVNHIDGDKHNNFASNLGWVTHQENHIHRIRVLGQSVSYLHHRGEAHPMARLTESNVLAILKRLRHGEKQVSIAKDYGVTQVMISRIKCGKAWQHVSRD